MEKVAGSGRDLMFVISDEDLISRLDNKFGVTGRKIRRHNGLGLGHHQRRLTLSLCDVADKYLRPGDDVTSLSCRSYPQLSPLSHDPKRRSRLNNRQPLPNIGHLYPVTSSFPVVSNDNFKNSKKIPGMISNRNRSRPKADNDNDDISDVMTNKEMSSPLGSRQDQWWKEELDSSENHQSCNDLVDIAGTNDVQNGANDNDKSFAAKFNSYNSTNNSEKIHNHFINANDCNATTNDKDTDNNNNKTSNNNVGNYGDENVVKNSVKEQDNRHNKTDTSSLDIRTNGILNRRRLSLLQNFTPVSLSSNKPSGKHNQHCWSKTRRPEAHYPYTIITPVLEFETGNTPPFIVRGACMGSNHYQATNEKAVLSSISSNRIPSEKQYRYRYPNTDKKPYLTRNHSHKRLGSGTSRVVSVANHSSLPAPLVTTGVTPSYSQSSPVASTSSNLLGHTTSHPVDSVVSKIIQYNHRQLSETRTDVPGREQRQVGISKNRLGDTVEIKPGEKMNVHWQKSSIELGNDMRTTRHFRKFVNDANIDLGDKDTVKNSEYNDKKTVDLHTDTGNNQSRSIQHTYSIRRNDSMIQSDNKIEKNKSNVNNQYNNNCVMETQGVRKVSDSDSDNNQAMKPDFTEPKNGNSTSKSNHKDPEDGKDENGKKQIVTRSKYLKTTGQADSPLKSNQANLGSKRNDTGESENTQSENLLKGIKENFHSDITVGINSFENKLELKRDKSEHQTRETTQICLEAKNNDVVIHVEAAGNQSTGFEENRSVEVPGPSLDFRGRTQASDNEISGMTNSAKHSHENEKECSGNREGIERSYKSTEIEKQYQKNEISEDSKVRDSYTSKEIHGIGKSVQETGFKHIDCNDKSVSSDTKPKGRDEKDVVVKDDENVTTIGNDKEIPSDIKAKNTNRSVDSFNKSDRKVSDWIIFRDYKTTGRGGYGDKYNVWTNSEPKNENSNLTPDPHSDKAVDQSKASPENNGQLFQNTNSSQINNKTETKNSSFRITDSTNSKATSPQSQQPSSRTASKIYWKFTDLAALRNKNYNRNRFMPSRLKINETHQWRPSSRDSKGRILLWNQEVLPESRPSSRNTPRSAADNTFHKNGRTMLRIRSAGIPSNQVGTFSFVQKYRPVSRERGQMNAKLESPRPASQQLTKRNSPGVITKSDVAQFVHEINQFQKPKSDDSNSKPIDSQSSQEMLDYFWSYQGMSRQMLGVKSAGKLPEQGGQSRELSMGVEAKEIQDLPPMQNQDQDNKSSISLEYEDQDCYKNNEDPQVDKRKVHLVVKLPNIMSSV